MSTQAVTITCPRCIRPVRLRVRVHVMASGELIANRAEAKRGMVIHTTKGCVAR